MHAAFARAVLCPSHPFPGHPPAQEFVDAVLQQAGASLSSKGLLPYIRWADDHHAVIVCADTSTGAWGAAALRCAARGACAVLHRARKPREGPRWATLGFAGRSLSVRVCTVIPALRGTHGHPPLHAWQFCTTNGFLFIVLRERPRCCWLGSAPVLTRASTLVGSAISPAGQDRERFLLAGYGQS
jgi:hypothetical protein